MNGYLHRIAAAQAAGHFKPGEVYVTEVAHAEGCHYHHTRKCTCWPLITAVSETEVLTIGTDGHVLDRMRKS